LDHIKEDGDEGEDFMDLSKNEASVNYSKQLKFEEK
jgi:hypothetical protein